MAFSYSRSLSASGWHLGQSAIKSHGSTIADYNTELYKAKVYDKITLKHVESMAAVGNDAAHNSPDLKADDVERFKNELVSFLQRFSL